MSVHNKAELHHIIILIQIIRKLILVSTSCVEAQPEHTLFRANPPKKYSHEQCKVLGVILSGNEYSCTLAMFGIMHTHIFFLLLSVTRSNKSAPASEMFVWKLNWQVATTAFCLTIWVPRLYVVLPGAAQNCHSLSAWLASLACAH